MLLQDIENTGQKRGPSVCVCAFIGSENIRMLLINFFPFIFCYICNFIVQGWLNRTHGIDEILYESRWETICSFVAFSWFFDFLFLTWAMFMHGRKEWDFIIRTLDGSLCINLSITRLLRRATLNSLSFCLLLTDPWSRGRCVTASAGRGCSFSSVVTHLFSGAMLWDSWRKQLLPKRLCNHWWHYNTESWYRSQMRYHFVSKWDVGFWIPRFFECMRVMVPSIVLARQIMKLSQRIRNISYVMSLGNLIHSCFHGFWWRHRTMVWVLQTFRWLFSHLYVDVPCPETQTEAIDLFVHQ